MGEVKLKKHKESWGHGPWENEPDEHKFEYCGFVCFMGRHPILGVWGGYVVIPEGHKYYKMDYQDITVNVHGGLTFGEFQLGTYVIGFDCAHSTDICPPEFNNTELKRATERIKNQFPDYQNNATYKDYNFVIDEIKKLVDQLKECNMNKKLAESIGRRLLALQFLCTIKYEKVKDEVILSEDNYNEVFGWLLAKIIRETKEYIHTDEFKHCFKEGAHMFAERFFSRETIDRADTVDDYLDNPEDLNQ